MKPDISDGQIIRREDECRLLFITACHGYTRPPVHPWKPSGRTPLHDTEILAQQHAGCNCHILEYKAWIWNLANGEALEEPGTSFIGLDEANFPIQKQLGTSSNK